MSLCDWQQADSWRWRVIPAQVPSAPSVSFKSGTSGGKKRNTSEPAIFQLFMSALCTYSLSFDEKKNNKKNGGTWERHLKELIASEWNITFFRYGIRISSSTGRLSPWYWHLHHSLALTCLQASISFISPVNPDREIQSASLARVLAYFQLVWKLREIWRIFLIEWWSS